MVRVEIRLAGFGGQGIMLVGYLLGQSACLYENREATQTESYGPEARGGAASTEVVISESEIDYPKLINPDICVLMAEPAFLKFHKDLKKNGIMIVDRDLVRSESMREDIKVYKIPATKIAQNLGHGIVANVVMLGALVAITDIITKDSAIKSITATVPERVRELNLKAFEEGFIVGKQFRDSS